MSTQNYAVIDASNKIVNVIVYTNGDIPPNPHPSFPNHMIVAYDSNVYQPCNGWTYVNGEFVAPPSQPSIPTPTVSDLQSHLHVLQAQIHDIQAQLTTLLSVTPAESVEPTITPQ